VEGTGLGLFTCSNESLFWRGGETWRQVKSLLFDPTSLLCIETRFNIEVQMTSLILYYEPLNGNVCEVKPKLSAVTWNKSPLPIEQMKLQCGPATSGYLGLRVQILQAAWKSLSCDWHVLSGIGQCEGPSTCPEESCLVCLCVCVFVCPWVWS
jgi:hypothetical protein